MKAIDFLNQFDHVPMVERNGTFAKAGTTQRRRWLEQSAVLINGKRPKPNDEISFPVTEMVFFPKSQRKRCTFA